MNSSQLPTPWLSNCKQLQTLNEVSSTSSSIIINNTNSDHLIPKITKKKKDVTGMFENSYSVVVKVSPPMTARESRGRGEKAIEESYTAH